MIYKLDWDAKAKLLEEEHKLKADEAVVHRVRELEKDATTRRSALKTLSFLLL